MTFEDLLVRYKLKPQCFSGVGDGWVFLLDKLFTDMINAGWDKELGQVKEKFGGLRVYVGEASEEIYTLIRQAELAASYTCVNCGAPADRITRGYWASPCCTACQQKPANE